MQVPWIVCGRLPLRVDIGLGQPVAVPNPCGGKGHTCRTPPRACSVSNATSQSVRCLAGSPLHSKMLRYQCYPVTQNVVEDHEADLSPS